LWAVWKADPLAEQSAESWVASLAASSVCSWVAVWAACSVGPWVAQRVAPKAETKDASWADVWVAAKAVLKAVAKV